MQQVLLAAGAEDRTLAVHASAALRRLGLAVEVIDLASDPAGRPAVDAVRRAHARAAERPGGIVLAGAGRAARAALDASRDAEARTSAVVLWNGRVSGPTGDGRLAAPSLLLADRSLPRAARRGQRRLAAELGPRSTSVVTRSLARDGQGAVASWYAGVLGPDGRPARRTARPLVVRGAMGLAAAVAFGAPAAAQAADGGSRFAAGKRVGAIAGDGSAIAALKPGDKKGPARPGGKVVAPGRVGGDGSSLRRGTGQYGLTDSLGVKWFLNDAITFSTSSSASGAMSEASFSNPVVASTLNGGTTSSTLNDAFDGYGTIGISTVGALGPVLTGDPSYTIYNKNGSATPSCDGRQYDFNTQTVGTLALSRKVFVAADDAYARWMTIVTNNGSAAQSVNVDSANNLGSDANTRITGTSSGDLTATADDTWVTTFQNFSGTTSSDPRIAHVLRGAGARIGLADISFVDGDDNPHWAFTLDLAPGETQIVVTYAALRGTREASRTAAAELAQDPPTACMTQAERDQVVNFDVGEPPSLSLPPTVTVQASEDDGAVVTFDATASDDGDGAVPVSCDPPSGSKFPVGTTTVTCEASDRFGRRSTGTFDVVVNAPTPPTQTTAAPAPVVPAAPVVPPAPAVDRIAPVTRATKISNVKQPITLKGSSTDAGTVRRVRVSVARHVGKLCEFLKDDGTFSSRRDCRKTSYVDAKGATSWSLKLPTLKPGRYTIWTRGIDVAGNVERKHRVENLLVIRVPRKK